MFLYIWGGIGKIHSGMNRVISFINYKGGTGKTTSSINIGACLAQMGHKVLLVDLDAQANLTEGLGIYDAPETLYTAFQKKSDVPITQVKENLFVIPSNLDCVGFDFDLARQDYRERVLQKMLAPVLDGFDFALLDLPPTLNTVVLNGLVVSDHVVIPLEAEFFAYRGLDRIMDIVKKVKENSKPNIGLLGVAITKYNPSRNLSRSITEAVDKYFDSKLFSTRIRMNVKIPEAQTDGVSIFDYAPDSNGAADYRSLTEEILDKLK